MLEAQIKEHGEKAKIKRLGLPSLVHRLTVAQNALNNYGVSTNDWQWPVKFVEERATLFRLIESYRDAVRSARRHIGSLEDEHASAAAACIALQREWRKQRDRLRGWLFRKGICEALAKVGGDLLRSIAEKASNVGISISYPDLPVSVPADATITAYLEPFLVPNPKQTPEPERDHWGQFFFRLLTENADKISAKAGEVREHMKKAGLQASIGSVSPMTPISFSGCSVDTLKIVQPLRLAVMGKYTGSWDISPEYYPFLRVPHFLTQLGGSSICTLIDPQTLAEHPDPTGWLRSLDAAGLQNLYSCHLPEGTSVFVPMGWVPCVYGYQPFVEKDKAPELKEPKAGTVVKHYVSYGITLWLSDELIANSSPDVRRAVSSQYELAKTSYPKSHQESDKLREWFSKVAAVDTQPSVEAVASPE